MEQPTEEVFRVKLAPVKKGSELYRQLCALRRQAEQRVQHPGANRRVKRTHLRGIRRPVPNKHSQLFISLLDSGRPTPY